MMWLIYESKSSSPGGLMNKKSFLKAIELENDMLLYNKKGKSFKNKQFNDKVDVSWDALCFAGRDAEIDPRTDKSKCIENVSYISALNLFRDNWKACFYMPDCSEKYKLGGPAGLRKL